MKLKHVDCTEKSYYESRNKKIHILLIILFSIKRLLMTKEQNIHAISFWLQISTM